MCTNAIGESEPAVAPDGAVAQCPAAGFVAFTSVQEIHVVDIPIGLIKVAVAVPSAVMLPLSLK